MSDVVLRTVGLGKRYRIGGERESYRTLRDTIVQAAKRPLERIRNPGAATHVSQDLWALRNVDLEVRHGEAVGIIGRNGAGKSTLLKILSRITEPTRGRAEVFGRVGSLLEVGTGFHPDLTGRENVYLNGTILGMKKREVDAKFDEIVEFSGVEKFIDTPVKRYSSGMRVRLGFSVAAHLEPEVLIIDEVLAVGDAAFQKKCVTKMQTVAEAGRSILLVSHNMATVQRLCTQAICLRAGALAFRGAAESIVRDYVTERTLKTPPELSTRTDRGGTGTARVRRLWIEDAHSGKNLCVQTGSAFMFKLELEFASRVKMLSIQLGVYDLYGEKLLHFEEILDGADSPLSNHQINLTCEIPQCPLPPGRYLVNVALTDARGTLLDHVEGALTLDVEQGNANGRRPQDPRVRARFVTDHRWSHR